MNTPKQIGSKIKELRIAKGLTQEDLAIGVNTSKGNISSLESGNRPPNFKTLSSIANFFDVEIDFIKN